MGKNTERLKPKPVKMPVPIVNKSNERTGKQNINKNLYKETLEGYN